MKIQKGKEKKKDRNKFKKGNNTTETYYSFYKNNIGVPVVYQVSIYVFCYDKM